MFKSTKIASYAMDNGFTADTIVEGNVVGTNVSGEVEVELYSGIDDVEVTTELVRSLNQKITTDAINKERMRLRTVNKHIARIAQTPEQKAKASAKRKEDKALVNNLNANIDKIPDDIKAMLGLA